MERYKENEISILADILKNDGVICVPTDTVYGLCTRINSNEAYKKLVEIKNRPSNKSFPVMCKDKEQIKSIAEVDEKAEKLIDAFMPGAVTLVLNKKKEAFVNNRGLQDTDEIGIRMAPTKEIRELIEKIESPIFMTSANKSGEEVCKSIEEIEKVFPNLDGILEGNILFGKSSTIINCRKDIKVQREGPITSEQIKEVLK